MTGIPYFRKQVIASYSLSETSQICIYFQNARKSKEIEVNEYCSLKTLN